MDAAELDAQRKAIEVALRAGLLTGWQQRAYTDADVRRVVEALQAVPPGAGQLEELLKLSGATLTPYTDGGDPDIEQSCSTCMYYEPHRRYCNLPELKLGVEPQWSCILWRI
jgi:hypothetical protein